MQLGMQMRLRDVPAAASRYARRANGRSGCEDVRRGEGTGAGEKRRTLDRCLPFFAGSKAMRRALAAAPGPCSAARIGAPTARGPLASRARCWLVLFSPFFLPAPSVSFHHLQEYGLPFFYSCRSLLSLARPAREWRGKKSREAGMDVVT